VATEQRTTGSWNPMAQLLHCKFMCLRFYIRMKLLTTYIPNAILAKCH
jgi:hypothetical protein